MRTARARLHLSAILLVVLWTMRVGLAAPGAAPGPYASETDLTPRQPIDKLVFGQLERLGIPPSKLCSDSVFVRHVSGRAISLSSRFNVASARLVLFLQSLSSTRSDFSVHT